MTKDKSKTTEGDVSVIEGEVKTSVRSKPAKGFTKAEIESRYQEHLKRIRGGK